jgi:hypothetical protein
MEKRCHSRMMLGQFWLSVRTSFVAVTKPTRGFLGASIVDRLRLIGSGLAGCEDRPEGAEE